MTVSRLSTEAAGSGNSLSNSSSVQIPKRLRDLPRERVEHLEKEHAGHNPEYQVWSRMSV